MAQGLDRLDAQLLLLHALGKPDGARAWLLAHDGDSLTTQQQQHFVQLVQRRAAGEPLAYITGHKEFFGLDLDVDARVLVPRPDTETLVEWALQVLADFVPSSATESGGGNVLDLGTGSGAVALALQHARPDLRVHALDTSADALQVALANAQRLRLPVKFMQGSWLAGVSGRYQAIVSNPPYIAALDRHLKDLAHEPMQALVSGKEGLDDIRQIVTQAGSHLHAGGWLLLEHGYDQAAAVRDLLVNAGFEDVQSRRDLSGIERCSGGRWP
jgi:release factor glutamine methyltransferase